MPTLTQPAPKRASGHPPPNTPAPPGGRDGGNRPEGDNSGSAARIAIWVGMVASTMTFIAMVAAMFVRRKFGDHDWHRMPLPPLVWWNTLALLVSSVAVEIGRKAFRAGRRSAFRAAWLTACALGTWFLIGQSLNWKYLADHGFYMKHNPASAFFYVLTWAHAAHVVGALAALYFVAGRSLFFPAIPGNRNVVDVSSIFWHFLDVMWLALMGLFLLQS